jgi:chromosome partitioning protein
MHKIAVALSKGGVGKTTTAVNLAAGLARAGKTVLVMDVDTQGQAGRALGLNPPQGLAEVVGSEASFETACVEARPNLWLLSGGRSMAGLKRAITRKDFGGEQTLSEALQDIEGRYDYVIIDTSPGWDAVTINVLFYTDSVLSPVSLEVMTLQGLMEFARSMASIQRYRAGLELKYVLPTFFDRRVRKSEEILGQLQGHFNEHVCTPVRYNVRLSEAPGYGQTIFEYAPGSTGAQDYLTLTERILSDDQS